MNFTVNDKQPIWGKYGRMWALVGRQGGVRHRRRSRPARFRSRFGRHPDSGGHDRPYARVLPNLMLDGVVGYERQGQHLLPNDFGTNYGLQFGIPNTNGPDPLQSGFLNIASRSYTGFGVPNWMPVSRVEESYTHSDNLTWTKGAHEIRFGFDLVRHHLNHWQPEIGNFGPRGDLGFGGGDRAQRRSRRRTSTTPTPRSCWDFPTTPRRACRTSCRPAANGSSAGMSRDRWQVSRNLTINIGLRYEFYPLMTRAGKGIEQFNPNTNQVALGGRGNTPENAGHHGQPQAVRAARRPGLSLGRQDRDPRRLRHQLRSDSVLAPAARLVSAGHQQRAHGQRLRVGPAPSSRAFRIPWVRTCLPASCRCPRMYPSAARGASFIAATSRPGTSRSSGSCRRIS